MENIRKELESIDIKYVREIHRNLPPAVLTERAVKSGEGIIAANLSLIHILSEGVTEEVKYSRLLDMPVQACRRSG